MRGPQKALKVFSHGGDVKMFSRSRWVTTAAGIFGSRSGADRVYRPTELPQYYYLSNPQLEATGCIAFLHCGFLEYWRFWVRPRSWRRRLSQLDPTRVHPAARSSPALHSFCSRPPSPCSKMVHVLWFMFCALGQSFPRSLPWKSLTTVSPRRRRATWRAKPMRAMDPGCAGKEDHPVPFRGTRVPYLGHP